MNHVGLVGRMTKTPELKESATERKYTTFVLAVTRHYRNNQGEIDADFVYCSAWGKLAEHITKYCGKGSLIGVTGRLNSRSYTNKDNVKVYATEVIVEDVRFYTLKNSPSEQEEVTIKTEQQLNEEPQFDVIPENFEMNVEEQKAAT